jgi:hypothetical protein
VDFPGPNGGSITADEVVEEDDADIVPRQDLLEVVDCY